MLEVVFSSCLRILQAQLWAYWGFWCPHQYRLGWQALTFCKTHSKLEATQQPSSRSPQQSWEAEQHNWACSQVTAMFLLVCMSTGIIYASCWLPPPALIANCVSAVGLRVGSWGKTFGLAASNPTFYPQAAGALVNTGGLVELGFCGLTESLHRSFILMHFCLLEKIIQTILNETKLIFFLPNRPLLPRLLNVSFPLYFVFACFFSF